MDMHGKCSLIAIKTPPSPDSLSLRRSRGVDVHCRRATGHGRWIQRAKRWSRQ